MNTLSFQGLMADAARRASEGLNGQVGLRARAFKRMPLVGLLLLAACTAPRLPSPAPAPPQPAAPSPVPAAAPAPVTAPPQASTPPARPLPAPAASARFRNWDEFRLHAGRRLVQANPNGTYTGAVPEPLLAIPVLEVELNADGSIRRIVVQRQPSQARDTVQLAIDAVQRAAPFGDISHLPRPWKFSEVFLFRDDRRFKPRALDL